MHIIQLHKTIAMHIIQLNHQFLENIKSVNIYGLDHWFHPFKCFSSPVQHHTNHRLPNIQLQVRTIRDRT